MTQNFRHLALRAPAPVSVGSKPDNHLLPRLGAGILPLGYKNVHRYFGIVSGYEPEMVASLVGAHQFRHRVGVHFYHLSFPPSVAALLRQLHLHFIHMEGAPGAVLGNKNILLFAVRYFNKAKTFFISDKYSPDAFGRLLFLLFPITAPGI